MDKKKKRKTLSRRLKMQQHSGRHVHVLDDEMVDNLCGMLSSTDDHDVELAKEIIFKSKMSNDHITRFVNGYLNVLLGFDTYYSSSARMTINAQGNVGIGNIAPSYNLSISSGTSGIITYTNPSLTTSTNNVTYTI